MFVSDWSLNLSYASFETLQNQERGVHKTDEEADAADNSARRSNVDHGWAWVVMVAAFCSNAISMGIVKSVGIFNMVFLDMFEESRGLTSLTGALISGLSATVGVFASILINRFSCRVSVILGGVLASFGFILSFFATDIIFIIMTYGFIAGIGLGFVYTPTMVVCGFHFQKRRAFAIGIAATGTSVGQCVLPPLIQVLVEYYTWRGTLLITAGICLHLCVCGALMRPTEIYNQKTRMRTSKLVQKTSDEGKKYPDEQNPGDNLQIKIGLVQDSESVSENAPEQDDVECDNQYLQVPKLTKPSTSNTTVLNDNEEEQSKHDFDTKTQEDLPRSLSNSHRALAQSFASVYGSTFQIALPETSAEADNADEKMKEDDEKETLTDDLEKPPYATTNTAQTPQLPRKWNINDKCYLAKLKAKQTIQNIPCLVVFSNKQYLIFFFCMFFWAMGTSIVLYHLPAYSVDVGISEIQASTLLSVFGVANAFGRLFIGSAANTEDFPHLTTFMSTTGVAGCLTLIFPLFAETYIGQNVYAACFAIYNAALVLTPCLIVEIVSLKSLSTAFGLLQIACGAGFFMGPPFAGYIYDSFGHYDNSFFLSGLCFLTSSALTLGVPLLGKKSQLPQKKADDHPETSSA